MESEKVKEIKKALQTWDESMGYFDDKSVFHSVKHTEILDYINELESENERLKIVVDIANERTYRKKFIDEWRKEYQKELDKQGKGHIAGYPDFDLVYKLYFEQKDRIAELEKKVQKYKCLLKRTQEVVRKQKREELEIRQHNIELDIRNVKAWEESVREEVKNFVKVLKAKMPCEEVFKGIWDKIDETLKEFINDANINV